MRPATPHPKAIPIWWRCKSSTRDRRKRAPIPEGTCLEHFGKYHLRERIAVGGMAEVFDAVLPGRAGFERRVAIKRILPQFSADESFLSMFVDEAKIAVQLSHSNIAQILELGCVEGAYFIAMEFVEGRDLRFIGKRLRKRQERMPVPVACYLVMQVAEALAFAHEATGRDGQPLSVTHRDLSPHNIMVTHEGGVKAIDFGLAKAMGRATQTRKGILKGKLAYMSPEQSLGQDVDPRSDLFSLGACFYEMLTGERLFMRATQVATVTAVRESTVPPIRSIGTPIGCLCKPLAGEGVTQAMEGHGVCSG